MRLLRPLAPINAATLAVTLALLLALVGCAHTAPAPSRSDVEAVLHTQVEAWNRGDLEGFCAYYADDARFVSPSGLTTGRDEILRRYDQRYRAEGKEMGTLTLDVENLRFVGHDAATVAMRWTLTFSSGESATGLSLIALERGEKGWLIVDDASM